MKEKKYRLLKDTPAAKAGTILRVDDDGYIWIKDKSRILFHPDEAKEFDLLGPKSEWIEEVKDIPKIILNYCSQDRTIGLHATFDEDEQANEFFNRIDEVCQEYWSKNERE